MIWIILIVFAVMSIVLLSGHGASLIAGYNTASREEQEEFDIKKLCRITGAGMLLATVVILIFALWGATLPTVFAYIALGIIFADCAVMIRLAHTICKK